MGGRWWWSKYEGEETVILDEFRHQIKYDAMLKIMDRYPMWTEYKGGTREFTSKKIVITTNIEPMDWYPGKDAEGFSMLRRRILEFAEIWEFRRQDPDTELEWENIQKHKRTTEVPRSVGGLMDFAADTS